MAAAPLQVWQFSDGKRGHERQCEGLIKALGERLAINTKKIPIKPSGWRAWLSSDATLLKPHQPPAPQLVIGAGHATHRYLLAAKRLFRAPTVCLMRPSLPFGWFDLVVIPRHDQPPPHNNVLLTEGVLNPVTHHNTQRDQRGLVLLGGPSRHHRWDSAAIARQVRQIVDLEPALDWQLSDSRRTPADTLIQIKQHCGSEVTVRHHQETGQDWLPQELSCCESVWVSADSVAMIYEALSSGARVGVLSVSAARDDRISRIAPDLAARGWLGMLPKTAIKPPQILCESARVADHLIGRWPALFKR